MDFPGDGESSLFCILFSLRRGQVEVEGSSIHECHFRYRVIRGKHETQGEFSRILGVGVHM